jgi:hypothetical protein
MKRWAFILSLVTGIGFCNAAQAQKCTLTYVGNDSYSGLSVSVGKDVCNSKTVTYTVSNGTPGMPFRVYIGQSCPPTTTTNTCELFDSTQTFDTTGSMTITYPISDIVKQYGDSCDKLSLQLAINLYITSSQSTDVSSTATYQPCTSFVVNTQGLKAIPTNLKGSGGQNAISVSWDYSQTDATNYRVFYVIVDDCETAVEEALKATTDYLAAVSAASESDSGADAGADAGLYEEAVNGLSKNARKVLLGPFQRKDTTSKKIDLSNKIKPGQELAVSVSAMDSAGNISVPSEPICVQAVYTNGFCDLTKCKSGCSVEPIGKHHMPIGFFVIVALLALVWADRRRRS